MHSSRQTLLPLAIAILAFLCDCSQAELRELNPPPISDIRRELREAQSGRPSSSRDNLIRTACGSELDQLLHSGAQTYGHLNKTGFPDIDLWLPRSNPLAAYRNWIVDHALFLDGKPGDRPPISAPCPVMIDYDYKFIWVKTTKTAGTSMMQHLTENAGICGPGGGAKPKCLHRALRDRLPDVETATQVWGDFFVFGVARNPFDRAGSSYDYTLGLRTSARPACRAPSFKHFTARPYVIGLQDETFDCMDDKLHNYAHVEPQSTCLVTPEGGSAVDYLIRYESLEEDFQEVIDIINKRRDPALPPLRPVSEMGWSQKGPLLEGAHPDEVEPSRHAPKYRQCGAACLQGVAAYYKEDFDYFRYATCV